jgi:uncharacterized delta-60 repeat protein
VGRLNADGSLDTNFLGGASTWVAGLALQPDGKVLVWGLFSALAGQPCSYLGRVNADGTFDAGFNPNPNNEVSAVGVLPDGRILVGGDFTSLGGQPCNSFGCLNANGSLDTSFNPQANGWVGAIAVQADGKILIAGDFSWLGGVPRSRIGRLHADGSLDPMFDPGADNWVNSLALQGDGNILVSGQFTSIGGASRGRLGRLTNTEPASQALAFDSSTVLWSRGGAAPEIARATFESSTNGADWVSLGEGTRVAGGWRMTGISAATNTAIRARGFARGGQNNGSGWFVESTLAVDPQTPPRILTSDEALGFGTNGFGFNLSALIGRWSSSKRPPT